LYKEIEKECALYQRGKVTCYNIALEDFKLFKISIKKETAKAIFEDIMKYPKRHIVDEDSFIKYFEDLKKKWVRK